MPPDVSFEGVELAGAEETEPPFEDDELGAEEVELLLLGDETTVDDVA